MHKFVDDVTLVTGAAGFIGFHLTHRLLAEGRCVVGVDDLNDHYDPQLKRDRLAQFDDASDFEFIKLDIADRTATADLFAQNNFDCVAHLAAQAGVRSSLENPHAYIDSNLLGFTNVLEECRHADVEHLVFASSSSVYGANEKIPYAVSDNVDHPISLYAATKKSNELLAHSYAHLYDLPVTGLRFFTAYGPWGRPDMAYFLFADAITRDKPIKVFGNGSMQRDFTYVKDIVEGVARVLDQPAAPDLDWNGKAPNPASSRAPYRIYNVGNGEPVGLMDFIETLEEALGKKAEKKFLPMQPGDVRVTYADSGALTRDLAYHPSTSLKEGIERFVKWYRQYYDVDVMHTTKA